MRDNSDLLFWFVIAAAVMALGLIVSIGVDGAKRLRARGWDLELMSVKCAAERQEHIICERRLNSCLEVSPKP